MRAVIGLSSFNYMPAVLVTNYITTACAYCTAYKGATYAMPDKATGYSACCTTNNGTFSLRAYSSVAVILS